MGFYKSSVRFSNSEVLINLSVHKPKFELFWSGFMCANNKFYYTMDKCFNCIVRDYCIEKAMQGKFSVIL